MNRLIYLIIIAAVSFSGRAKVSDQLSVLDRMLQKDYILKRQQRIDSIKSSSGRDKEWEYHFRLAGEYADFNVDSALYHIRKAEETADNEQAKRRILVKKGSLYNGALMMQKEASDIFDSLHSDAADTVFSREYFTLGVQLYKNLQEMAPDSALRRKYALLKRQYRDSVLTLSPDAFLIRANQLLDDGNIRATLNILLPEVEGESFSPSNGAVYHIIAKAYGLQGNTDKQIEYLTLAAEADISNGVREYEALPQLAYLLYERGDVERANRYIRRSIDDAMQCSAGIRVFNMSETLPVITQAHNARQHTTKLWLISLSTLLALALIAIAVSLYYSRQRNRMLHQSQSQLKEANRKLEAAGAMREEYGKRFMKLSLNFMDRLTHYRLYLLKIASKRNFDNLYDAISSTSAVEKESEIFYQNFDTAFLELYPDFIEELNSLLRPEERIKVDNDKSLNTELRIFALMKLGISESAEIAKLLHCSQSTVYNYRTRYRAKAINKEEFVKKIFPQEPHDTPT